MWRENSNVSIQCIGIAASSGNKIMFILTEAAGKLVNTLISLPTHLSAKGLSKSDSPQNIEMFLKLSKTILPLFIVLYIYFSSPWRRDWRGVCAF